MAVKKILIDLTKLKNLNSGLGQVSLQYGKALSAMSSTLAGQYRFTFLVPSSFVNFFGDEVDYLNANLFRRYLNGLNSGFDLWHAIHQDSAYMPSKGTPYLLTIHDLNFLEEKQAAKALRKLFDLQRKVDRAVQLAAISNYTADKIRHHLNLGNKEVKMIYNGVNIPAWNGETKMEVKRPFFLTLSHISAKKNLHVLIPMMKLLPQYDLIIAGTDSGTYAQDLKSNIKHDQVGNIVFTGALTESQKAFYLYKCEALFFPSLYEGFGMPVIEAMGCGKPVFCSKSSSLPEIGADKAFYFENFEPNEMANLVSTKLHWVKQNNGFDVMLKNYAAQFNWQTNVTAYLKLYTSLIN